MRVEPSGKPDAGKLARPVWGWGRGETPRPTPHGLASGVAADINNGGLEEQVRYLVERLGTEHAERQLEELVEKRRKEGE